MRRLLVCAMLLAALAGPGCQRRSSQEHSATQPSLLRLHSGEPPPLFVEGKTSVPPQNGDQTLILLAEIVVAQEEFKKEQQRTGEFIDVVNENVKSMSGLGSSFVALEESTRNMHAQLEKRVAKLERQAAKQTAAPGPLIEVEVPAVSATVAVVPQTAVVPAATVPVPFTGEVSGAVSQPGELARAAQPKLTPYAQTLRRQVRDAYERVIKDFPGSQEAEEANLGLAAMAEEDLEWDAAAAAYKRALQQSPDSLAAPDAHFRLAGVHFRKGDFDNARRTYLLVADMYPRHPNAIPALLAAADCLDSMDDTKEVLREYHSIERNYGNTSHAQAAREKIASLYVREKRHNEAIVAYRHALQSAPAASRTELELNLALAQLGAGNYSAARETLQQLLPRTGKDALGFTARWHLARAYEEDGLPLDAGRAYIQLADAFPGFQNVLQARMRGANAFLAAELAEHAGEQVEAVLAEIKDNPALKSQWEPDALFASAKAAQIAGDLKKAGARIGLLRSGYPNHHLVLDADLDEANALVNAGKTDEAVALLRQSVRTHPNSPRTTATFMRLAELQERSNKPAKGVAVFSELLNYSANADQTAHLRLRRGLMLYELGQTAEAAQVFRSLLADASTPPGVAALARYQLAMAAQRTGDVALAIAELEQFVGNASGKQIAGVDLSQLLDDAKWKLSKLKWLAATQRKIEAPPGAAAEKGASL